MDSIRFTSAMDFYFSSHFVLAVEHPFCFNFTIRTAFAFTTEIKRHKKKNAEQISKWQANVAQPHLNEKIDYLCIKYSYILGGSLNHNKNERTPNNLWSSNYLRFMVTHFATLYYTSILCKCVRHNWPRLDKCHVKQTISLARSPHENRKNGHRAKSY